MGAAADDGARRVRATQGWRGVARFRASEVRRRTVTRARLQFGRPLRRNGDQDQPTEDEGKHRQRDTDTAVLEESDLHTRLPSHLHHDQVRHRAQDGDRKSTRLNSSHVKISYAVFCLKKKKKIYYCSLLSRYNMYCSKHKAECKNA